MLFRIEHRTTYRYAGTASESFMEARLTPVTDDNQRLLSRQLSTTPASNVHHYTDYFGNAVETFSIVHRHAKLRLDCVSEVETHPHAPPTAAQEVTISEARQIFRSEKLTLFEFLAASPAIGFASEVNQIANQFFRPGLSLGPALLELNHWFKREFRYTPGATRIDTPVLDVLRSRKGVCQDFAQLMIAILRSAEIPARYVVGYIETDHQRDSANAGEALLGAAESHAWVEVFLPGGFWWPLDPTNDCVAGERHVKVAVGRDYLDSTPTRGVFKGTHTDWLNAAVVMTRLVPAL
ncbi:transglutaminase domain-containing protein [Nibricoccus sp. IMCC34717]|uniref:transglutaminase family protein n=1 Tax=Nibricoccus sp. IMCC34717 TaxID=3034021 RepID=UPI00384FB764